MNTPASYKIRIAASFNEINPTDWDALIDISANNTQNPFVTHAYLSSLEDSGSATVDTGWLGQHLLLEGEQNELLAALPCYLKNHSQGEYVFDHGWADAFERAGGRYYPKLQCSIPFTPATGPRLLAGSHENSTPYRSLLATGLKQLCHRHEVSSAHITFMPEGEWRELRDQDFLMRIDQQFHWQNNEFSTFQDFLGTLSSRKRKNIKKERNTAAAIDGIEFEWIAGKNISEAVWDKFYEFYLDTGSRKWGQPYLTRQFYSLIGERMPENIVLIMAMRDGKYIAGAINFISKSTLFGRHWGCSEYHPALHFEICYYQAMEYAIAHGLKHIEAGAQGEHKLARGYLPVTTHSAHWIENRGLRNAVDHYLQSEREHVKMEGEILTAHAPFRKTDNNID